MFEPGAGFGHVPHANRRPGIHPHVVWFNFQTGGGFSSRDKFQIIIPPKDELPEFLAEKYVLLKQSFTLFENATYKFMTGSMCFFISTCFFFGLCYLTEGYWSPYQAEMRRNNFVLQLSALRNLR